MTVTLYGLNSCDTCRKARRWLDDAGVAHGFHDLRADGVNAAALRRWTEQVDWSALLNRRSTTWRGLGAAEQAVADKASAIDLMLRYPTLIKRPVLETDNSVLVGFDSARYRSALEK